MNSIAGCNSLTKLHELVHDGTVSRVGGRKIHLQNGENVSLDVIKRKYEQLVATNQDSNPALGDLPAIFSRWEEQIKKSEPELYQPAAAGAGAGAWAGAAAGAGAGTGAAAGAGAGPREDVTLEAMIRQARSNREWGCLEGNDIIRLTLRNKVLTAVDVEILDSLIVSIFLHIEGVKRRGIEPKQEDFNHTLRHLVSDRYIDELRYMSPDKFAKALEFLYARWTEVSETKASLFLHALLTQKTFPWANNIHFSLINPLIRREVIEARIEILKSQKSNRREDWEAVLKAIEDLSGKNSDWYKQTEELYQKIATQAFFHVGLEVNQNGTIAEYKFTFFSKSF